MPLCSLSWVHSIYFSSRVLYLRSELCLQEGVELPRKWHMKRPEELRPEHFIQLTADLFGELSQEVVEASSRDPAVDVQACVNGQSVALDKSHFESKCVWRRPMYEGMHTSNKKKARLAREQAATAGRIVSEEGGMVFTEVENYVDDEGDEDYV